MKPFLTLAETHTPVGSRFTLHEHDGEYFMTLNGRQLMSTSSTASELLLEMSFSSSSRGWRFQ
jgi:hypothetical protein